MDLRECFDKMREIGELLIDFRDNRDKTGRRSFGVVLMTAAKKLRRIIIWGV